MRMMLIAVCALSCVSAHAADHVVSQSNKTFSTAALSAKVGDQVSFRNDDPFVHNIFSLSEAQSFDLGTFGKGESRALTLQKEGTVEVECAVHPEMKLVIEVKK